MNLLNRRLLMGLAVWFCCGLPWASAQDFIPRKQTKPPGPALSPVEALARMTVPSGFKVELVAAEPDLLNPVAMAFDDRGRVYVTESFEYPRHDAGPGRDRVKILEDRDGDGRFETVKIFAEGLNIPSGIAVGHGGVWVANAPDILFLEDTDGDDRADRKTVVVTGFGRDDTHELPNALTWGPDGYLYGLNGVFNRSVVKQDERSFDFTCALFRIDPVTRRFDLFCEGTSNPWGVTFDREGSAFVSACVIDHLWHLTETGYYHRQGGPYPAHTWKIDSIVNYQHQLAAYCGIEYFDSPAYPAEYRNRLYMGNIHGGCINVDSVTRHESTYRGAPHPDFLTANDVWFMPVAQKVGPDGCLYILDWYDRYHCYQDASADPRGVDRANGRLYRVVYQERPAIRHANLDALSDEAIVGLLSDANIFYRQRAQVQLAQRFQKADAARQTKLRETLAREMHAASGGGQSPTIQLLAGYLYAPNTSPADLEQLLDSSDANTVAWAVRALATRFGNKNGNVPKRSLVASASNTAKDIASAATALPASLLDRVSKLSQHADPRVRLQVAIAANKLYPRDAWQVLLSALSKSADDGLFPRIVWQNLELNIPEHAREILAHVQDRSNQPGFEVMSSLKPRLATRLLATVKSDLSGPDDVKTVQAVFDLGQTNSPGATQLTEEVLESLLARLRTGELKADSFRASFGQTIPSLGSDSVSAIQLQAFLGDASAFPRLEKLLSERSQSIAVRRAVLATLAATHPESLGMALNQLLEENTTRRNFDGGWRDAVLDAVIRRGDESTVKKLVSNLNRFTSGVQATMAERLAQRDSTAILLLEAIEQKQISKDTVSPNQVRSMAANGSARVKSAVQSIWGTVRTQDSADRQKVVREMVDYLRREGRGNPERGLLVYDRVCGQCHVMHNRGSDVGPNITRNARGSFEQLVVSVFDPSLVIGDAFKSLTVVTADGRIVNGLVIEQTDQRVVLKIQGGKQEIIPTSEIESMKKNDKSLMPEGLENQLTKPEIADLFALLTLENPPDSAENSLIPGTPADLHPRR